MSIITTLQHLFESPTNLPIVLALALIALAVAGLILRVTVRWLARQ